MDRTGLLVALAAALLAAAPGGAQNLVGNSDFDANLDGWTDVTAAFILPTWENQDWAGDPQSGSLQLENEADGADTFGGIAQCVVIPEADGTTRDAVRAEARVADGDAPNGSAELFVTFHNDSACAALPLDQASAVWDAEIWGAFGLPDVVVPALTHSIRVALWARNADAGGSITVFFDHVFLPEADGLASGCAALLALGVLRRRV